jgi:hypothetical protein
MTILHRWGRPTSCGALKVTNGQTVRWLAGELFMCVRCEVLRKQSHGGRNATYSRDHGRTWGSIGGPCPPCDSSLVSQ